MEFGNFGVRNFCLKICLALLVQICDLNPSAAQHFEAQVGKVGVLLVRVLLPFDVKKGAVDFFSLFLVGFPKFILEKHRFGWRSLTNLIFGLLYSFGRQAFLVFGRPKNLIFYIHLARLL